MLLLWLFNFVSLINLLSFQQWVLWEVISKQQHIVFPTGSSSYPAELDFVNAILGVINVLRLYLVLGCFCKLVSHTRGMLNMLPYKFRQSYFDAVFIQHLADLIGANILTRLPRHCSQQMSQGVRLRNPLNTIQGANYLLKIDGFFFNDLRAK